MPQENTVDLSKYGSDKKANSNGSAFGDAKNKNGVYVAVMAVSFSLTIFLYVIAFKNENPGKPDFKSVPAVYTWDENKK